MSRNPSPFPAFLPKKGKPEELPLQGLNTFLHKPLGGGGRNRAFIKKRGLPISWGREEGVASSLGLPSCFFHCLIQPLTGVKLGNQIFE